MYAADCVGVQCEVQLVHLRVVHWQGVRRGLACRLVVCREWGAALDSVGGFHAMCKWDGAPTVPPPIPLQQAWHCPQLLRRSPLVTSRRLCGARSGCRTSTGYTAPSTASQEGDTVQSSMVHFSITHYYYCYYSNRTQPSMRLHR